MWRIICQAPNGGGGASGRAAAEAVPERLEETIAAQPCHAFVKQAMGAEVEVSENEALELVSAQSSLVAPTGFEPVSRG